MKKIFSFCFVIILLVTMASCGPKPEEQVKDFAVKFGDFVNTSQKDSIQKYYPDFELTDSLATVPVGNITVTPQETEGVYLIEYSPESTMIVSMSQNGKIIVDKSKGILAFLPDKIDLAKKTGMWDDSLSDSELAERMNDEEFLNFISKKINFNPNKILTVGKNFNHTYREEDMPVDYGYYTITNNTNDTIYASDYKMNFKDEYSYCEEENNEIKKYNEPGKEIAPNSTIKIESSRIIYQCRSEEDHHLVGVTILLTPEEIQKRFASFSGNEYQEYLDSKK